MGSGSAAFNFRRGYRYFVYNDEIIIVEPDTLRIVAVLLV